MNSQKPTHLFSIFISAITIIVASQTFANSNCFLVEENQKILKKEGDIGMRHPPCSTFKIAISLMGFEEGILIDETHPQVAYEEKYGPCFLEIWKEPHNPKTWIRDSCVWYSQWITNQLGMKKFKSYITEFKYGNEDVSGDPGKENGLTQSWLCSSLKISPKEQVELLEKLLASKLPVSERSQEMTRKILYVGELTNSWKLYGKTGSGYQKKPDGSLNEEVKLGWFVGWIEKGSRKIVFAYYIQDKEKVEAAAGPRARDEVKERLKELVL